MDCYNCNFNGLEYQGTCHKRPNVAVRHWLLGVTLLLASVCIASADQPPASTYSIHDLPLAVTSMTFRQGKFQSTLSEYVRWGGETSRQQLHSAFKEFTLEVTHLSAMVGHTDRLLTEYDDILVDVDEPATVAGSDTESSISRGAYHGNSEQSALESFGRTKQLLGQWNDQANSVIDWIGNKVDVLEEGDAILHHNMRRQLDPLGDTLAALQLAALERQGHIDRALVQREQLMAHQIRIGYIAFAVSLLLAFAMLGHFLRQKARTAAELRAANEQLQGKVEEANQLAIQLEYNATRDQLTELHNRHSFAAELDRVFTDITASHGIVFIDLDKFKIVNDTCGHAAGDALLRRIAELLSRHTEGQGIAARFGGDEFVLLLPTCGLGTLRGIANCTCRMLSQMQFKHDDHCFPVGGSFGAVLFEPSSTTPSLLM